MPFTFKQFHIDDRQCGMSVSTDGVLLGAWADLCSSANILDIGAGSGLLSLMAAQRTAANVNITAVELDSAAANACKHNISQSPWPNKIKVYQEGIQEFVQQCAINTTQFEQIICNPPYFEHGPQAKQSTRADARHTNTLTFDDLQNAIKQLLTPNGRTNIILPQQSLSSFAALLPSKQLTLTKQIDVASVTGKQPSRVLLELQHQQPSQPGSQPPIQRGQFDIKDPQGQYTPAMTDLCRDFYLKL
ncbi:tRNA1(Val) (adenine(37)-N6)-methyltransferase [Shewanella sp. A14]